MKDRFIRFTTLISGIMRNIRRIMSDTAARYDIRRSCIGIIYYLYRNGPLTATKICRLCGEDKANVSRALKTLEDDGYIAREERPASRSRVRMLLTEEGNRIGALLDERIAEVVAIATEGIDAENIEMMYEVLGKIDENLAIVVDSDD